MCLRGRIGNEGEVFFESDSSERDFSALSLELSEFQKSEGKGWLDEGGLQKVVPSGFGIAMTLVEVGAGEPEFRVIGSLGDLR